MTAEDLQRAERLVRRASTRHDAARDARDKLVRQAAREGWTHAQIADATGLTRSRVGQIALQAAA